MFKTTYKIVYATILEKFLLFYTKKDGEIHARIEKIVTKIQNSNRLRDKYESWISLHSLLFAFELPNSVELRSYEPENFSLQRITQFIVNDIVRKAYTQEYPEKSICITDKENGAMLGCIIRIGQKESMLKQETICSKLIASSYQAIDVSVTTIPDKKVDKPVTYYVKMYRGGVRLPNDDGLISHMSSDLHDISYSELFVYKVLDYLNIGPKTHFLYSKKEKFVLITTEEIYGNTLHSTNLLSINDTEWEKYQPSLLLSLTKIELICRIFCLFDVMTNQTNIVVTSNESVARIIDFDTKYFAFTSATQVVESFKKGDDVFNYDKTTNKILRYAFYERPLKKRLECAILCLSELELELNTAIQQAMAYVTQFIDFKVPDYDYYNVAKLKQLFLYELNRSQEGSVCACIE